MTPLRQRLLEDMPIRNLASSTPRAYVEHVSRFVRHFGRSPARLGPEEIRADQQWLLGHRSLATTAGYLAIATTRVCASASPLDVLPRPVAAPSEPPSPTVR